MACFHPLRAWQAPDGGAVTFGTHGRNPRDAPIVLPCGGCLGCRQDRAREWALRCHLELQQHRTAVFTTLTYDDAHLPPTLSKPELQRWLKRLRKKSTEPIRFFASGEYGETFGRPHYHALIYGGKNETHTASLIEATWRKGLTHTVPITPAAIAYVAGYTSKKIGWRLNREERVWAETGEVYTWEPPFIQMSRRPGIGSYAKQWPASWRNYAVHHGRKIPVPKYLHAAWKAIATEEEIQQLKEEKKQANKNRDTSKQRREAAELLAIARQRMQAERRNYR